MSNACGLAILCSSLAAGGCASHDAARAEDASTQRYEEPVEFELTEWPEVTHGVMHLPRGGDIPYTFEMTNKGNGGLDIKNLGVRVYDGHSDERLFNPYLLSINTFSDEHEEGFEVSGVEVLMHEWKDGVELGRHDLYVKFVYDQANDRFVVDGDDAGIVYNR